MKKKFFESKLNYEAKMKANESELNYLQNQYYEL